MFILTATAQIAGIKVNLPKASSSMALSQPKTKAISVNDAGQVFLDAYPVTLPELEDRLRTEKALNPDFPVIVRGDAAVPEGRGSAGSAAPPGTRPGRPGHRQAAIGAEANVMSFPESDSARAASALRWLKLAAVAVALAAAAYLLWRWANDMSGVRREPPKVSAIIRCRRLRRRRPSREATGARAAKEEQQPVPEPEPVPTPEPPKPQDEAPPRPADDLANPMQIDGDAQAGNDAFNIGAGQGKGMSGGGGAGNATYSQYLAYALQKILREDERTRNLTFRLQANIWLTASGQVTRVELTKSSGDADVDARVVAALRAVPALDERPPASVSMPIRASLTGRRPS